MPSLQQALRLSKTPRIAFVGAGGKTTTMYSLAHQLASPVIVTATTHLGGWQIGHADKIHQIKPDESSMQVGKLKPDDGVVLFIGSLGDDNRFAGLDEIMIGKLHALADEMHVPLLIEADGSRMRPLKAPAEHEPNIPNFVDLVVVIAGMSALGKNFSEKIVHRPREFSKLSGIQIGDEITPTVILKVLCDQCGGLKNIPQGARKILLLNQTDPLLLQKITQELAIPALSYYDSVIVASLKYDGSLRNDNGEEKDGILSIHEHIAGIILAAGGSQRFGQPKQLLDWNGKPLIWQLTTCALASGLTKVIVVLGANAKEISPVLQDLPVDIVINPVWKAGQSSSIHVAIHALADQINAAIFILGDQPFISPELINALIAEHTISMAPIIAPMVNGQRGNPILFDRETFAELLTLKDDKGGRAIFNLFSPQFIQWSDPKILMDIDTPEDYFHLRNQ